MIKTNLVTAEKCPCGNSYYFDRYIGDSKGCPACDPELGETPEMRIHNYKMLISPPKEHVTDFLKNLFGP